MKARARFLEVLILAVCFCFLAGCEFGGEADDFSQPTESQLAPVEDAIVAFADYDGPRGMVRFSAGGDSNSRMRTVEDLRDWEIHVERNDCEDGFLLESGSGSISIPIGSVNIYLTAEPSYESNKKSVFIRQNSVESVVFTMIPRGGEGEIEVQTEVFDRNITLSITKIEKDFGYNPNITKYIWIGETLPEGVRLGDRIHVVFDSRMETGEGRRLDAEGIIEVEAFQYFALVDWGQNAPENGRLDFVDVYTKSDCNAPALTLSPLSATPLSGMVVAGTSKKLFLKFNLTANSDVRVSKISVSRKGISQDTDVGNLRLFCNGMQVANSTFLVDSRVTFPVGLVIPKGMTKEIILKADVDSAAGVVNEIYFSVDPADIVAVAMDNGESVSVSGTEVRGNPMQIISGGSLVCSSNPDQILGVIQGGESGGFFSTTLKGKLKMSAVMEDIRVQLANVYVDVNCSECEGIFVERIRIKNADRLIGLMFPFNGKATVVFPENIIEKDFESDVDIEADLVVYNRDVLPEIAIRIDVVPEAVGLASSRVLTQENGGVTGDFTAIFAKGFLSRDVLQVNCNAPQKSTIVSGINDFGPISLVSGRDIRINKIIVAAESEKDNVEFMEVNIVDPLGFSYIGSRNVEWDVDMEFVITGDAQLFLRAAILNGNPEVHTAVKLAIIAVDAVDADSGEPIHVVGLPVEFTAAVY